MKTSRFQFEYRDSASSLHRAIGEILRNSDLFGVTEIYQEYPVCRVNEDYDDRSHHFDWVLPKLKIVFEGHGKQHYSPVAFDGDNAAAISRYHDQKKRDKAKKQAALNAEFVYVEVPWHAENSLDEAKLMLLYENAKKEFDKYRWEYHREAELSRLEQEREKARREQKAREEKLEEERKAYLRKQRDEYLASERHRQELVKAREFRQLQYQKLKESRK